MIFQKSYKVVVLILFIFPFAIAILKYSHHPIIINDLLPKEIYQVNYHFDISNLEDSFYVKAYLPLNTKRQKISFGEMEGDLLPFTKENKIEGLRGIWRGNDKEEAVFSYGFQVEGKQLSYDLDKELVFEDNFSDTIKLFLEASEFIQSSDPLIQSLATQLKKQDLVATLLSNFEFVKRITDSSTGVLTDAKTALQRNRASCNGKSRLFVALCRAQGIPGRVAGGIILEDARKRTSHLWTEIYYQGNWLPFDVMNDHFAQLPANYLELYKGDHFLITHTKGIGFDYQFDIHKVYRTQDKATSGPQLWPLLSQAKIPLGLLRGILILPLAALLIAVFRNVIGLKTFGIFLPALIGLALFKINFILGVVAFCFVIVLISMLHLLMEKWGMLHVPKVVIMLTTVVMALLGMSSIGLYNGLELLNTTVFLPVVVLSITAERFAKTLVEERFTEALKILGTTFFVAICCYPLFQSDLLVGFFLSFPECYLMILGLMLLLGRWIGMRVMEYKRFAPLSLG